ncbi:unnamed protein product [Pleuronectes platessa]|uniref:Uncharacterized protein n=1 Tax=Pleuronectes platessa TaxID=8262 RepID=A0A9N7TIG3_PLEPL|nr:unnamed protein product [Pleuronectes platessa]
MSHILDIQPHHPHYPPTPPLALTRAPPPNASHQPAREDRSCCATPPHWLPGCLAGWLGLFVQDLAHAPHTCMHSYLWPYPVCVSCTHLLSKQIRLRVRKSRDMQTGLGLWAEGVNDGVTGFSALRCAGDLSTVYLLNLPLAVWSYRLHRTSTFYS